MLFQNVLHHWALLTIYVVLIVLTSPTLNNFWGRVLDGTRWYRRIVRSIEAMPKLSRWLGWSILAIVLFSIRFLAAPLLWIVMILTEGRRKKREAEKYRQQQEAGRIAKEKKDQENLRRAEARKQWFAEHPPKLYFNTVSGVTSILRPDVYNAAIEQTTKARRNGFWEKDNVLFPAYDTVIFVTKQGKELIDNNLGGKDAGRYKIAGWLSALDEIVQAGNAELVHVSEIFVPWVNEAVVPFSDQKQMVRDSLGRASYLELILPQAPRELLPV